MKIAVLGSAPSSIHKAPFGDPSWQIWACSPGAYPALGRVDEFWEVHRWEPGVIGKPNTQRPWFTPEYVAWLKSVPPILHVADPVMLKDCPNAVLVPIEDLEKRYGSYVWTSSVSYMIAMAIDKIQADREVERDAMRKVLLTDEQIEQGITQRGDCIAFYGVDMAATDELYTSQRFAAQWFIQIIVALGIEVEIPPESDLATPPPKYGFAEISHRSIKWLTRMNEIEVHIAQAAQRAEHAREELRFFEGAKDDMRYMQAMWMNPGEDSEAVDLPAILGIARIGDSRAVKRLPGPRPVVAAALEAPPVKSKKKAKRKPVRKPLKKGAKKKRR